MFFHALFNGKAWSTMELHVLNMELQVLNQGIVTKQNKTWSTMYFHEIPSNISRVDGESPKYQYVISDQRFRVLKV